MGYSVTDSAADLLTLCEALFAAATPAAPFSVYFLSPGPPTPIGFQECDGLAISGSLMQNARQQTQQDPNQQHRGVRPILTLSIFTYRCVVALDRQGKPPSSAIVTADGHRHLDDLHIIWSGLARAIASGEPPFDLCSPARLVTALPYRPDSAGGWQITVELPMNMTYTPAGS
jgi:hypothetical protein